MTALRHYFGFALCCLRCSVQRQLEYPVFLLGWILMIPLKYFSGIWMIHVLVDRFQSLAGWTFPQISFLYGVGLISHSLQVMLFIPVWNIERHLQTGRFDRMKLYPMGVFFQLLCNYFNVWGLIDFIPAVTIFLYGANAVHFSWTPIHTVELAAGILEPTSGQVWIAGLDPQKERTRVVRQLGVVFGQRSQLEWDLRLGESFELLRRIYYIQEATYRRTLSWLEDVLQISDLLNNPVRTLSLGQRMRGELAAALLHDPPILFLDEPTIGLDIEAKYRIRDMILEINRSRGTTVLLTTHDLDDVEQLCQRLIVINHGKIVEDGPIKDLIFRLLPYRVLVVDCERVERDLCVEGAEVIKREGHRIWFKFDRNQTTASQLIARLSALCSIRDLSVEEPDIEDMIQHLYQQPPLK